MLDAFPADPDDLALHWIVTPERIIEVAAPPPAATGIDRSLLSEADPETMPILSSLRPDG